MRDPTQFPQLADLKVVRTLLYKTNRAEQRQLERPSLGPWTDLKALGPKGTMMCTAFIFYHALCKYTARKLEVQIKPACQRHRAKKQKKKSSSVANILAELMNGSSREEKTMEAVSVIKQRQTHPLMGFRLHRHCPLVLLLYSQNTRSPPQPSYKCVSLHSLKDKRIQIQFF